MIIVFVNCSRFPFVSDMIALLKLYETRTRNMLGKLAHQRIYIAETGRGPSVVRCSAILCPGFKVTDPKTWDALRPLTRVQPGSIYDWTETTKQKWLYELTDVQPVPVPFHPAEGVRHGRVWMEVL